MSLSPTASLTPGATVPQSPAPSVVDSRRMSLDAALSANGNGALRSAAAAQRDAERWRHAERAVALLAGSGWGEPSALPRLDSRGSGEPCSPASSDGPGMGVGPDADLPSTDPAAVRWGWLPPTAESSSPFMGEVVHAWRAHRRSTRCLAVDDAEELLLTGGSTDEANGDGGGIARVWDIAWGGRHSGACGEYRRHSDVVTSVVALTRRRALSVDRGGECHVWLLQAHGACPTLCELRAPATPSGETAAFASAVACGDERERALACTADGRIVRLDLERGCTGATWSPGPFDGGGSEPGGSVAALACDAAGDFVLAGFAGGGLAAFDARTGGRPVAFFMAHEGGVSAVLAAGGASAGDSGALIPSRDMPPARSDAERLSSYALLSGGVDRAVRLWDVRTWRAERTVRVHKDAIAGLCLAGRGRVLSWAGPRYGVDDVRLANAETGKAARLRRRVGGAKEAASTACVASVASSRVVFAAGDDGLVRVVM